MKFKIMLLSLTFLAFTVTVTGEDFFQQFTTKDHFTVNLPDDWVEIPKEILDEYSKMLEKTFPDVEKQICDYGFQKLPVEQWFTFPYIIIQINRSGKTFDESEFGKYKRGLQEGVKEAEDKLGKLFSEIKSGEPLYDPVDHILWMTLQTQAVNVGLFKILIAFRFTSEGFLKITCCAQDDDYEQYSLLFEQIVRKIELSESLKYESRTIEPKMSKKDWGDILIKGVPTAIIILVLGLIMASKNNKKEKWMIKKSDGTVYGPVDTKTLRRWVQEKRVLENDYARREGLAEWRLISSIRSFRYLFGSLAKIASLRSQ